MDKIQEDKTREILFARRASNLLRADKVEEAREICEHGLKLYPTYAPGHYILAKCYLVQSKFDEARVEFERVLRYDPNHLNALLELSQIYKATGLQDIYKDYLLQLLYLDPMNDTVRAEAKSLGLYQEKKIQTGETQHPQTDKSAGQSAVPHKRVDLSQFDNLDDDFETILEGRARKPDSEVKEEEKINLGAEKDISENEEIPQEKRAKFPSDLPLDREEDATDTNDDYEDFDELEFNKNRKETDKETGEQEKKTGKKNASKFKTDIGDIRKTDKTDVVINPSEESKNTENDKNSGYEKLNINSSDKETDEEKDSEFKQPKIVSQTLGEILVSQKKYSEALEVFKTLQKQNPDSDSIRKKISFLTRILDLEKK